MPVVLQLIFSLLFLTRLFANDSVLLGDQLIEGFGNKLAYYEVGDLQKDFLHAVELKKRVTGVVLSHNKKILLVKTDLNSKSEFFGLDLDSRKILFRSPEFNEVVGYYWMDECHFAVVSNNHEHGGTVYPNPLPEVVAKEYKLDCKKMKISLDKVPAGEMPKSFVKMDEANLWAYYSNGSRSVVGWLSDGAPYDFVVGKNNEFYFREAADPSKIFKADFGANSFTLFLKADGNYKVDHKGRLILLNYQTKKLVSFDGAKSRELLSEQVVQFHLDISGRYVFARLENGQHRYIKL